MTTLTIRSDSERKTLLLIQLAEELGLPVITQNANVDIKRTDGKIADAELINYFTKESSTETVFLDETFSRYIDN